MHRLYRTLSLLLLLVAGGAWAGQPEYSFVDINGAELNLTDYRGKWVVVNYWATWCPPCQEEIPELIHFHDAHKDKDAIVIGLAMEETAVPLIKRFVDDNMMSYSVVRQYQGMPAIGVLPGLPTTYMIDPKGRIAGRKVGKVTVELLEKFIAKNGG